MKRKLMLLVAVLLALFIAFAACGRGNGEDEENGDDEAVTTPAPPDTGNEDPPSADPVSQDRPLLPELFGWQSQFDNHGLSRDPITLTMNTVGPPRYLGPMNNISCYMIRDATGITVSWIEHTEETFGVAVAVNDLPDLIAFADADARMIADLIMTGQLVDMLPFLERTQYLYRTLEGTGIQAIRHWTRENTGIDGVFWLPREITNIGDAHIVTGGSGEGFFVNLDIYAAIGAPPIYDANGFNEDMFLDMLYQMQQYARTELGIPHAYALGGFIDWGQQVVAQQAWNRSVLGQLNHELYWCSVTREPLPPFHSRDHYRWDSLRFTNRAYRMGIFDPQAYIMNWDQYHVAVEQGEILVTPWQFIMMWHGPGQPLVDPSNASQLIRGLPFLPGILMQNNPIGWGLQEARAINANLSDHEIERVIALFDYAMSDEFFRDSDRVWALYGVHWDYDPDNGYPRFINERLQQFLGNEEYTVRFGSQMEFDYGMYSVLTGLTERIHADGHPQRFMYADFWLREHAIIDPPTQFFFDLFNAGPHIATAGQLYMEWVEEGILQTSPPFSAELNFMPEQPSELADIAGRVRTFIDENETRLVFASSDEEFEAILAEILAQIYAMGEGRVHEDAIARGRESQRVYNEMMGR